MEYAANHRVCLQWQQPWHPHMYLVEHMQRPKIAHTQCALGSRSKCHSPGSALQMEYWVRLNSWLSPTCNASYVEAEWTNASQQRHLNVQVLLLLQYMRLGGRTTLTYAFL